MKKLSKISGLRALAIVFVIFISFTAATNADIMIDALRKTRAESGDLNQFIDNVKTSYTSQIKGKEYYINLNGLFAKCMGRTVCNEVATLNNGMLTYEKNSEVDIKKAIEEISKLGSYIEETGREFLFVQVPYKMDVENELLPLGLNDNPNITADRVVEGLQESGIDVLDLRQYLASTPEQVENHFYHTDHHWNNLGAFEAFGKIVEKTQSIFPKLEINTSYTNSENWEKTTYEDWFLGTRGKRVGVYFGGVDDYVFYEPVFDTDMTCYVMNHMQFYKGNFTQVNAREEYLDEPNHFEESPYCVYIGGDYPIVQHRNKCVENDFKILIFKDSFCLPVQSFLSTVFSEVEVLDPRYYKDGSIAEYIEAYDPDFVMFMINPSVMYNDAYFTYGIDEVKAIRNLKNEAWVLNETDIELKENTSTHNSIVAAEKLNTGTKYTFRVEDVEFITGKQDGVTIALYNAETDTIHASTVITPEFIRDGNYEWTFITPSVDGELQLLLYSGIYGNTQNISVIYKNASLKKYE